MKPLTPHPSKTDLTKRLDEAQEWAAGAETAPGALPWVNAHPKLKVGYALRLPEALWLKLKFLAEREANTSMHKMILEGIEADVARRLKRYIPEE